MKKWLRNSIVKIVVAMFVITGISPALYAEEVQAQPANNFHMWAASELYEGERIGVIPISWYNDVQAHITMENLNVLTSRVASKMESLNLNLNKDFMPYEVSEKLTKKDVIIALYNEIDKYEIPVNMNIPKEKKIVIFRGDGVSLDTETPATLEHAALFATRLINSVYLEANEGAKGLLWKVTQDGNTVYLLGSVHVAKHDIYPFSQQLKQAYSDSDILVVEANIVSDAEGIKYLQSKAVYTDGTTIKDHLSKESYKKLEESMLKLGVPKENYDIAKPWLLTQQLTMISMAKDGGVGSSPFAATLGIDQYFMTSALFGGKQIQELEGIKFQADMFDSFSEELQESQLIDTIKTLGDDKLKETNANLVEGWLDSWAEGNVEKFESTFDKSTDETNELTKEFSDKMFINRDNNMVKSVLEYLVSDEKKTYFIVAGAGHMVGEKGIIKQLQDAGFKVEQVK